MRRAASLVLGSVLLASPLAAQGDLLSACGTMEIAYAPAPPGSPSQRRAVDQQFRFLCGQVVAAITAAQPTIGIALSGGAHTPGTATTIGLRFGVPRVSVAARVNAALADLPNLYDGFTPAFEDGRLTPMGTITVPLASIEGSFAVGVFNGFSAGPAIAGLGAVDLLGSASFAPAVDRFGLTGSLFSWGAGARIGILQQGLILPGISVSGMFRSMGSVTLGSLNASDPRSGDVARFDTDLRTASFRAAITKGIGMIDLTAGGGYDRYSSDVRFDFALQCPPDQCGDSGTTILRPDPGIAGRLRTGAWNAYGDIAINFPLLNVVGELGYQRAMDGVTPDDLANVGLPRQMLTTDPLRDGRFFGSLGVRVLF